jgi:uncharacterized protein (TIGR00645 family)
MSQPSHSLAPDVPAAAPPAPPLPVSTKHRSPAEAVLERMLFGSRWLVAPLYVGLALSLLLLIWVFLEEFVELLELFPHIDQNQAVLGVLSLIDLSLAVNLVLIVIFAGYENFVSKFDIDGHDDRPDWMGKVDFTALKLKLISSMVAISGIHLLRVFMESDVHSREELVGLISLHLTFVGSGVLLAFMDLLASRANTLKDH